MNVHAQPAEPAFAALSHGQERKSLLRFIACGSVDHGKSTLIGRLLYDSKQVFDDQLDALATDSRKFGTQGDALDFSLLLDGLAAEREQNITIDVAYRFFSTARRKFIVIDAPGHEEYTANMATGASVADLALVLVAVEEGLTRQTKRHLVILSMLGVRHVVLAVNKMDRVGWSRDAFGAVEAAFRELATDLGFVDVACIPVAAKSGDNVTSRSEHLPWYGEPSLLDYLETVEPARMANLDPLRMPIQWVNRPDADFRGHSGLITSGEARVGMPVKVLPAKVLPAGQVTRIARIVTFDGDLSHAAAGRSVTLTFTDPLDASRGDIVAAAERAPTVTQRVHARIFWMKSQPLERGQNYLFKLATSTASARVEAGLRVIDLDTRRAVAADAIGPNEVGHCTLTFDRAIALDRYEDCKDTGSFILIDSESYDTVAMGCVEEIAPL
jgi:sulfate adenylyltransferase large subunit